MAGEMAIIPPANWRRFKGPGQRIYGAICCATARVCSGEVRNRKPICLMVTDSCNFGALVIPVPAIDPTLFTQTSTTGSSKPANFCIPVLQVHAHHAE